MEGQISVKPKPVNTFNGYYFVSVVELFPQLFVQLFDKGVDQGCCIAVVSDCHY